MRIPVTRRAFLQTTAALAAAPLAAADAPSGAIPPLLAIAGSPRERGRAYGTRFRDGIRQFLDREILAAFVKQPSPKDELLRYAGACAKVVRTVCPTIHDELEGVAEGAARSLEEVVLITLHEELYHRGVLPKVNHCTAVAVGPPVAAGATLVGQTWDWMESVYGLSSVVEWRRSDGPSVLAYGFPGLWCGAGLNSAGIALCWTSADLGGKALGARVGLPSYVLLTHLLYQDSLKAVVAEAKRDQHAGWFTFAMADGSGKLLNVEGSPKGVAVEEATGHLVRVGFGTRAMTGTPADKPVPMHPRVQTMHDHLKAGRIDRPTLQRTFADPKCGICVGKATIDMMVFDCTAKVAYLSRGPSYKVDWHEFRFGPHRG